MRADRFAKRERSPLRHLRFMKRARRTPLEGVAGNRDRGVEGLPDPSLDFVQEDDQMEGADQAEPDVISWLAR